MKKFAAFLMILSVSVFAVGCSGKTKTDENKSVEKTIEKTVEVAPEGDEALPKTPLPKRHQSRRQHSRNAVVWVGLRFEDQPDFRDEFRLGKPFSQSLAKGLSDVSERLFDFHLFKSPGFTLREASRNP